MKNGYTCSCGWQLVRGNLTRRMYALKKEFHAFDDNKYGAFITKDEEQVFIPGCEALRRELKQSGKLYERKEI